MFRRLALPLLLAAATCGCSSLSGWSESLNPLGQKYVRADAKNPAVEVACLWQPGEGRNDNGIPARGFAGQVFFFTARDAEPALVDGAVRIYLFADRGTPEERARPLKQFDFSAETWALHATKTSLGPGYSVFVPYPLPEPYQVRCQLRARFTPREGPVVWSEAMTMTLEGPLRPDHARDPAAAPSPTVSDFQMTRAVGPAAELGHDVAKPDGARRMRVQTLQLGGGVQPASFETSAPSEAAAVLPPSSGVGMLDQAVLEQRLDRLMRERSKAKAQSRTVRSEHPLGSHAAEPRGDDADENPTPLRRPAGRTAGPLTASPGHPLGRTSGIDTERERGSGRRLQLGGRQTFGPGRHPLMSARSTTRVNEQTVEPDRTPFDASPVDYDATF